MPEWPKDFAIKYIRDSEITNGDTYSGYKCIALSPHNRKTYIPTFKKPYFCFKDYSDRKVPSIHIYNNGSIPNMRCTQISEPSDAMWKNPFICVPKKSWYQFTWHRQTSLSGQAKERCLQWKIGAKDYWCKDYLCAQSVSKGFGKKQY